MSESASHDPVVATKTITVPPAEAVKFKNKQFGLWTSLLILLPILTLIGSYSSHLHYSLPTPQTSLYKSDGITPQFSERQALEYVKDLAEYPDGTPRYRILGTEEMIETELYLMRKLEAMKEKVEAEMGGLHQIELWHQNNGNGTHLFDFMDKKVWKKYINVGNVIVRLSDGTALTKSNAVLVNAHTDSTLPSPGAADDLVGVAAMLEALRVLAFSQRRLTNSVIFLFNGAEESLQDASHLFITQHELAPTVKAVINLEACGVAGPEIVFQATSEEMIRALSKTPRPYATVLASEFFSTGLILSDTDFRQFVEYGNLTGLDMALVQDSYKYHTRLDNFDQIEPGALQHMGENTLALLEYLTSNKTSMGNVMNAPKLPRTKTSNLIFFSGLGGKIFIYYSRSQATIIYGVMSALTTIIVLDQVDARHRKVYFAATLGIGASFLSAIVGANLAAFIVSFVMRKTMVWFRNEFFPLYLFAPPAGLSVILLQKYLSNKIRTRFADAATEAEESSLLEHATLIGQLIYYTIAVNLGHALHIGSTYLVALAQLASIAAVITNCYILNRNSKRVNLISYIVLQISPLFLGIEGLFGLLDLLVPLMGRLGADAPVDHVIATLTASVGFLTIPALLPISHRFGAKQISRFALFFTFLTAGSLGWFCRPAASPYDVMHPKRLLVLHMENITTTPPKFDLHVATVDGAPLHEIVLHATQGLIAADRIPVPKRADDDTSDWDIIYPISQFLTTYKIPLPPTQISYTSPFENSFRVYAAADTLNAVKMTRTLEIVMDHPELMWPVIAFNADVIAWDLPKPPERGVIRHHVKSVAAYGVTQFTLSVTLQLTAQQFAASMRQAQRKKQQRNDFSAADEKLAEFRVDFSALDSKGMYPSSLVHGVHVLKSKPGIRFFEKFEQRLQGWNVDAMLLSAVAGTAFL